MAVTITATKYFTGTGPIKFSEIRDTFGDLPGSNVRLSDYKRNSTDDIDWNEDDTITPRVPDATENAELSDTDSDIQISDYRNTIKQYDVEQSGNEEERVYADGNTTDWNNNLSKNINKNYDVNGTIYSNETSKYALTFQEGNYNNLYINVSGNIYGEGGALGESGGGALYLNNKYDGDKVRLSITTNGKVWAGGGGGVSGNDGNDGTDLSCREAKNWNAQNKYGQYSLCNEPASKTLTASVNNKTGDKVCINPKLTCQAGSGGARGDVGAVRGSEAKNTNCPDRVITSTVNWNEATDYGGVARDKCRGSRDHGNEPNIRGGNLVTPIKREYASGNTWANVYCCTPSWNMSCSGEQSNTVAKGTGGNGGNGGVGKGYTNLNVAINDSPHKGNAGNAGNTNSCNWPNMRGSSEGNAGNDGNRGGDWGQAAASGGAGGIAIRKKRVIINNANENNVKGSINNI